MLNLFEFYMNLKKKSDELFDKFKHIFEEIEIILVKQELDELIILAFENNQHSILNKLDNFLNCRNFLNNFYKENYNNKIGFDKMYKDLIKKKKLIMCNI